MSPTYSVHGNDKRQASPADDSRLRLYGTARWRRRRRAQLLAEPLCKTCLEAGRVVVATVADHIVPHRGDPDRFWFGALQSLCQACHSGAKQREEIHGFSDEVGDDGWPIDPRHPANARP